MKRFSVSSIEGLLDFRRNGQAHLEKDYSIDRFRKEASLVATVAALNKIQPQLPLDQRVTPKHVATETVRAIHRALEDHKKRRLEVAAAAIVAVETVVTWNFPVGGTKGQKIIVVNAAQTAAV